MTDALQLLRRLCEADGPRVMLEAHMDEIGFMVQRMDVATLAGLAR